MSYIEREAAIKVVADIMQDCKVSHKHRALNRNIKQIPTADVAPVRHGHWIIRDVKGLEKEVSCSVCHSKDYYSPEWYKFIRYPAYCSDCGAKMDEERKEG